MPDQLAEMGRLEHVNLNHNCFKELGSILATCDSMVELLMSSNRIEAVDGAVGALPSLKTLDLSCNCIKYIPDALGESLSLRNLNLYNN